MFNLKRHWALAGGVLAAILLAGIVMLNRASADSSSPWLSPSSLSLNDAADLPAIPAAGSNNIDCYFDHGDTCSYGTPYGLADTTGAVKLNNYPRYTPVVGYVDLRRHFFAIPNSNTVMTYTTEPVHGAYAYFNYNFLASMLLVREPSEDIYSMNQPPDGKLTDKAGHRLAIDLPSASFSQNSEWMIVSMPNVAMLRVNLRTLEVLPFAPGFSYDIGLSPSPITAITNDGRYAVFASKDFNRFAIYDLSTCGAVPDTISAPVNCQSRDLQAYMNNQVSGFITPSGLRFISDDALSFYTKYTQNGASKTSRFIVTTASGPIHQQDYMALGDSYISGEGTFQYLPGTDTTDNQCHVSPLSYPLLAGQELNFNSYHSVACSGATTSDVTDTSLSYKGQAKPGASRQNLEQKDSVASILSGFQPGYIDQLDFVKQYQPKTVSISVGGNDIGFSDILQSCVGLGTCYSNYEDRLELVQLISRQFDKLANTYSKVKQAGATDAKIYVVGYPQIAKVGGDCALNVHLNNDELTFASQLIDYLDNVIKNAAAKAGVYYVDTQDALNGHRLCEAGPGSVAMNGLTAGNDFPERLGGPIGRESYHPNAFGHELLESRLLATTHNLSNPMPAADSSAVAPGLSGLAILNAPKSGRAVRTVEFDPGLAPDLAYSQVPIDINLSGGAHALSPSTSLQVELHSTPLSLGSFTTDAIGNLTAQLTIPTSVPAGYHTLHFYGTDINGQPVDIYKTIYVAATADDSDGNGVADSAQACVGVDASGQDTDKDGVDDACDANIALPPTAPPPQAGKTLAGVSVQTGGLIIASQPVEPGSGVSLSDSAAQDQTNGPSVLGAQTTTVSPKNSITKNAYTRLPASHFTAAGLGLLALSILGYLFKHRLF